MDGILQFLKNTIESYFISLLLIIKWFMQFIPFPLELATFTVLLALVPFILTKIILLIIFVFNRLTFDIELYEKEVGRFMYVVGRIWTLGVLVFLIYLSVQEILEVTNGQSNLWFILYDILAIASMCILLLYYKQITFYKEEGCWYEQLHRSSK